MYKRILIASEGSAMGERAVEHGLKLAKAVNAPVTLVTVTERWSALDLALEARKRNPNPIQQFEEMAAAIAKKTLDGAAQKAKAAGVTYDTVHVSDKEPAEGIIATAQKKGCDLIVMGSHGRRGIGRLLLGSQAYEVLAHSKVPALIVR
ncbi:MAG: universal stress protein [Xanthobacteraceae bacterium]